VPGDRFKNLPPIMVVPRVAWFPMPQTGPGYYTLCNQLTGTLLQGPPRYPYPRTSFKPNSFYDIDWRYLDDPNNTEHDFFDFLKRQRFGDDLFMFTAGGEFRARLAHEENRLLTNVGPNRGRDDTYDLFRLRAYADLWITQYIRIYAEFLSATSPDYDLPPAPIDRDPYDFLNLFVDVRTLELTDNNPIWLRVGRQELLYGSQRLISPLDWANTRRTFQGIKAFYRSQDFDLDAFVVNPVVFPPGAYAGGNPNGWTAPDTEKTFAGIWGTYKFRPGTNIDLYYLMLDDDRLNFIGSNRRRGEETINTIGTRFVGDYNNWLWDFEPMAQFGTFANQLQSAWACAAGGGYYFADVWATPTFWLYYDFASGTHHPVVVGNNPHTFNQLFPFGHYYFGWLDLVGRQNIQDFSAYATLYPADWLFTQIQCHNFFLDAARDALFNAGGVPIRQDITGRSGRNVGTELDFIVNFHIDNHSDLLVAYSYMFAGRFIRSTATMGNNPEGRENPQAFWVQYSFRW
jgi:hypothetical protein